MADFFSDEWFSAVLDAAEVLPTVDGLTFTFDLEVAESVNGKVRAHGRVDDGRLTALAPGKFVPADKGDSADVSFGGKAKRLLPIVHGEQPALVAYMLGELKIDGAYELVVDRMANDSDRDALERFRAAVSEATAS